MSKGELFDVFAIEKLSSTSFRRAEGPRGLLGLQSGALTGVVVFKALFERGDRGWTILNDVSVEKDTAQVLKVVD